jgi:small GTP-binding protein
MPKNYKTVVVGDGAVGKTCILWCYAKNEFPTEYVPTVFDNYVVKVQSGNQEINLQLWDTAGQEDLENIRVLSYTNTNVFLLCFAVSEPDSYYNVQTKWLRELNQYNKDPVIILVGTKVDLRGDTMTISKLQDEGKKMITEEQGKQKAQQIGAVGYLECSALNNQQSVKAVFDFALKTAMKPKAKKICTLI